MKYPIFTGALAAIAFSSGALAGDMSGYFGNTVMCKYANGDVTRVMVDANGIHSRADRPSIEHRQLGG
jgi:hypothetical protein